MIIMKCTYYTTGNVKYIFCCCIQGYRY